jgi:hypothetical protein
VFETGDQGGSPHLVAVLTGVGIAQRTETGVGVTAFEVTFHRSAAVPGSDADKVDILSGESGGYLRTPSRSVFR